MKSLSKEERDQRRALYEKLGWKKQTIAAGDGRVFDCYLIPKESCPPALPNAVIRITPSMEEYRTSEHPDQEAFFGVSEEMPEKFRQFAVMHEVFEFLHIGLEHSGRCAKAAEMEIRLLMKSALTPAEKNEYLNLRLRFFQDLVVYTLGFPDQYTPDDVEEFRGSLRIFHHEERLPA